MFEFFLFHNEIPVQLWGFYFILSLFFNFYYDACFYLQTLELARNPAMLQELMRTQDRAMSNLEVSSFHFMTKFIQDSLNPNK